MGIVSIDSLMKYLMSIAASLGGERVKLYGGDVMKKILTSAFVLMAVLLCAMSQAWADNGDLQAHGAWRSIPATSSDGISIMFARSRDNQSALSMAISNSGNLIRIVTDLTRVKSSSLGKTVSCEIRVGKRKKHNARCRYVKREGLLWIDFLLDYKPCLDLQLEAFGEKPSGVIRIKVSGIQKPFEYPLNGFQDAFVRCGRALIY